MRKIFFIGVLCTFGIMSLRAQSVSNIPPEWVKGYFKELPNSYIEVASGTATDRDAARNKAAQVVMERRNLATGQRVSVNVSGGNVTVSSSGELTVKARVLDEYAEHRGPGEWVVYLLVQTSKHPDNVYETITVTDRYPFSLKSFIPGMAQLDKGQTGKGVGFIVGEVVFVGGMIACEGLRAYNANKISSTHNAQLRMNYTDNANTFATMRNVCIAGAAVVYVWNIVDALVVKGPKRVLLSNASMMLAPYAVPEGIGVALNIHF